MKTKKFIFSILIFLSIVFVGFPSLNFFSNSNLSRPGVVFGADDIEVGPGEKCPSDYEASGTTPTGETLCSPLFSSQPGGSSSGKDCGFLGCIDLKFPDPGQLVSNLYVIALFVAGLFFLIQLTVGGISWMGAGGDPKALQAARARLMNAMIGLVIVVAAFTITTIILAALGINIFSGEEIQISPPSI